MSNEWVNQSTIKAQKHVPNQLGMGLCFYIVDIKAF